MDLLHNHVDVHVGGIDLRFPHHENERAQSNSITETETVDIWVHGEHLLFEGRKMSKSSGNVVLLQDVINRGFDPLALRLSLLENRYRSQMDLTWAAIAAADETIKRWRGKIAGWGSSNDLVVDAEIESAFNADIDTPKAIIRLRAIEKSDLTDKRERFLYADQVLGLNLAAGIKKKTLTEDMQRLLTDRALARAEKRWADSDRLRLELETLGLTIKDSAEGQVWS
jgi:cysteinyl-tRNA synthetase